MKITVSKSELKPKLLEFLRKIEIEKRPIIITDRGRPVAQIIPVTDEKKEGGLLASLAHSVTAYEDPLNPVGAEDWDL